MNHLLPIPLKLTNAGTDHDPEQDSSQHSNQATVSVLTDIQHDSKSSASRGLASGEMIKQSVSEMHPSDSYQISRRRSTK